MGLAVAADLAQHGARVTVVERGRRCGEQASAAAAGMLAEGAEATEQGPFQDLCRRSRELWPDWAEELHRRSGIDCELDRVGLVRVTTTESGRALLERQSALQRSQGIEVSDLLQLDQLRQLVPALGPLVLAGLHYPGDWHVHSHRVVEALVATCWALGVVLETEVEVSSVAGGSTGAGLELVGGARRDADYVVVCAGSWSGSLWAPRASAVLEVEPIRGQIVAVDPGRFLLPKIVFGDSGYLLQKRSGLVLLGTTQERAGYQPWPTLEGVLSVSASAQELIPEVAQARLAHVWAGLRPHAPDGLPLLGRLEPRGRVVLATAHYRNGILLAPVTAELIGRAILEGDDPAELQPFSPRRLA